MLGCSFRDATDDGVHKYGSYTYVWFASSGDPGVNAGFCRVANIQPHCMLRRSLARACTTTHANHYANQPSSSESTEVVFQMIWMSYYYYRGMRSQPA